MADLQTITIASGSGDTVTGGGTKLRDDLIKVANNFADTADPAATTHGRSWLRTDEDRFYYRNAAGAKTAMLGPGYKLFADLDCNAKELDGAHAQEFVTGSLPAAGAGEESRFAWDSTKKLWVVYTDAGRFYLAPLNLDGTDYFAIPCDLNVTTLGTPATPDVQTKKGGFLLDAASEALNWNTKHRIPDGWTGAHDLKLDVAFMLDGAEAANDVVDARTDWIAETPASGDDANRAVTASAAVAYDIGGTAIGAKDLHTARLTLAYNDATNPVAAGDMVSGTIVRTAAGGAGKVAGIIVYQATLLVPVFRLRYS